MSGFFVSLPFQKGSHFVIFFAVTGVDRGLLFTEILVQLYFILQWDKYSPIGFR